ncbi:MAG: hypothetical protein ACOX27_09995 [Caldicoprobacterales bacterium]|jgi:signal transduction histidine kinase
MGYFKFGLKLLGSHALMTAVQSFLFLLLFGIFESEWYQWIAGIFFIALFWFIIYADASHYGQNDLKRGTFRYSKGFLSGLVASVPALILYVLSLSFSSFDLFRVTLRIWLIPYIKLMVAFENYMPAITIVFILLFPLVTGFSYIDGIRRRNKIMEKIREKESMRAELSKRNQ